MAKILLSFSSHLFHNNKFRIGCFYEGLIQTLAEEGNQILVINAAEFLHQSWNAATNNLPMYFKKTKIIKTIHEFSPELVIAFNHAIPTEIEEACECPFVLWDADSIPFWNAKDYVKQHLGKYLFFGFSYESLESAKQFGVDKKNTFMIRPATSIKAEQKAIQQNICFIGTNFVTEENFINRLKTEDIKEIRKTADSLVGKFYDKAHDSSLNKEEYLKLLVTSSLASTQNRITALNNVQDLGLTIWGTNWIEVGSCLPWLAMCYNKETVYSVKHNQDIYNSSKLCISISHAQATHGFPWRIMDVMASNGCLVSDYKSGIEEFTKGYLEMPMYKSPYDARKLCKKLLADSVWREEIVLNSQRCIEERGRWQDRFLEIEQICNIQLLSNKPVSETDFGANTIQPSLRDEVLEKLQKSTHKMDIENNTKVTILKRHDYISKFNQFILDKTQSLLTFIPIRILRALYRRLQKYIIIPIDSFFVSKVKKDSV